jgi:NAD(P)-dependent dehydrogenase (short-subunit alcohol dehydrogenase family)
MDGIAMKMGNVVVTGVSSGIGEAIAGNLVSAGFRVFGGVRREDDGVRLSRNLGESFVPLMFDVTDEGAVRDAAVSAAEACADDGIVGLVNNAGIAVAGPLLHITAGDVRAQMEVNVVGVLSVTKAFFPLLLKARRSGRHARIVNMSSVSGRIASPFLGPYAASKHALEALSDSLRRELVLHGVDVIVVEPGRIETPIWAKSSDLTRFAGTEYADALCRLKEMVGGREGMLPSCAVARVVGRALTAAHPRSRYVIVENRLSGWWLPMLLPDRWLDRLTASRLGLRVRARPVGEN